MGLLDTIGTQPQQLPQPTGPFGQMAQYMIAGGQNRRANQQMQQYAQMGAARLEQIGTPQAQHAANVLRTNPQLFFQMTKGAGGPAKYEMMLMEQAQSRQAGQRAASAFTNAGQDDLAAIAALDPQLAVSVGNNLKPQAGQWKQVFNPKTGNWEYQDVTQGGTFQAPGPSGTMVTMGPDGQFQVAMGPGAASGRGAEDPTVLAKPTVKALQEKVMTADEQLGLLSDMSASFDRDFLTWWGKLENQGLAWAEKAGADLSPENQAQLERYDDFVQTTSQFANEYIRAMTGAQMSEHEAERLMAAIPNADLSPTQYKRRLAQFTQRLRRVNRRRKYLLARGVVSEDFDWKKAPIGEYAYKALEERHYNRLYDEMVKSGVPEDVARKEAARQVIVDAERGDLGA